MGKVIHSKSEINYNYTTIKITQSRIDKGLIAIPASLIKLFPEKNQTIELYLSDSPASQKKHYSSLRSSTRKCRIGGMKEWFRQNDIKSGDEIVIQVIDKDRFIYRLIPEKNFIINVKQLQDTFDASKNEEEAFKKIEDLSQWTKSGKEKTAISEYIRLIDSMPYESRRSNRKYTGNAKENVPLNIRILLEEIYKGHCQLCDFWFLKKDRRPYFEIHHLNPFCGHHPKNLIVVCGNCHNQFEYSEIIKEEFEDGWIVNVSFTKNTYTVKQTISKMEKNSLKEVFL
jgi:hypothetical protein